MAGVQDMEYKRGKGLHRAGHVPILHLLLNLSMQFSAASSFFHGLVTYSTSIQWIIECTAIVIPKHLIASCHVGC